VTQYGRSILYRNNGDGTFTDVTEKAGVAAPGWASSAVWFDYDNDGLLDLFVCRFVDFDKSKNLFCDSLTKKYSQTDKPHVRMTALVVDPARLSFADIVASTHNHTDHLDAETLCPILDRNPP
jgi:FG-GAP-like repeat